jgi:hypothetical protein
MAFDQWIEGMNPMLAIAFTLALFGFVLIMVVDLIRHDGRKIVAALEGRSWTAGPTEGRPVTIRFNPQRTEVELEPMWQPVLRAAA